MMRILLKPSLTGRFVSLLNCLHLFLTMLQGKGKMPGIQAFSCPDLN